MTAYHKKSTPEEHEDQINKLSSIIKAQFLHFILQSKIKCKNSRASYLQIEDL